MERKAFGIDLGTTYSAIAVCEDGETQILKNAEGMENTPSVIFFTGVTSTGEDDLLVGQEAKNSAETEPNNVVQFIKRKMGQSGPAVNFKAPSGKTYTPEMLSSFILRKVCQDAEQYVGEGEIKDVVITVPAYFDDARRTATKQAGAIASLNVLAVINEPTAAAIAYGFGKDTNARVLVYDLGGGTFDVTIMDIKGGHFDALATGGDSQLGGFNFDGRLSELIQKKLTEQGAVLDDDNDLLFAEIREKAERAKRMLTDKEVARLRLKGIKQPVEITREEFEEATADLLERTRVKLEQVMAEKSVTWEEIDELLVIGWLRGRLSLPVPLRSMPKAAHPGGMPGRRIPAELSEEWQTKSLFPMLPASPSASSCSTPKRIASITRSLFRATARSRRPVLRLPIQL